MSDRRVIVAIPARLASSRLPRKVLVDIHGKPMIERTYEVATRAQCGRVVVLADDEEVADIVRGFGGEVLLTDPELESGTARIASVVHDLEADVIVNLQGDAPLTDPEIVAEAARRAAGDDSDVVLPVYPMTTNDDVHDPNVVKVVLARDRRVLYCSRSPVPHLREADPEDWAKRGRFWGHVGIYAYRREFLAGFGSLPPSELEDSERLEQLRWLDAGYRLGSFEVEPQGPSVDTPALLDRVRGLFT